MQAVLSFDQAPPFAAPFRFFVTAPFFALIAGVLLAVLGPEAFSSRWTPGALALTHLLAIGFLLQVMLGAMIQILPVVAGANLFHPLVVARVVHPLIVIGALALSAGFLGMTDFAMPLAMATLATAAGLFFAVAVASLRGIPQTSPSIGGFKLAMLGLLVTVLLGLLLAGGLRGYWLLPLIELTQVHANWAFGAWALALLSAVAYVVVPMFQITPPYPAWFSRRFGVWLLLAVLATSLAILRFDDEIASAIQMTIFALAAGFCGMTLWLQSRSRRTRPDATQKFWRMAMLCGMAACLFWALARMFPELAGWRGTPLLVGVLLLVGGFMSVIIGMLYKIIPFLIWLHLQNRGQSRVTAPNMKAVLAESRMLLHFRLHAGACAALVAATVWPDVLTQLAGVAFSVAACSLLANVFKAAGVYRRHAARVDARLAEIAADASAGSPAREMP